MGNFDMTSVGVVMSLSSPWSRRIAKALAVRGHTVHVFAPEDRHSAGSYLRADDEFQAADIAALRDCVAAVHVLAAPVPGNLRYFAAGAALRWRALRAGCSAILALYGGGPAVMAWASGIRPYAVYVVGSDTTPQGRLRGALVRAALRGADRLFVNGVFLNSLAMQLVPQARASVLYIGVDTREFVPGVKQAGGAVHIVCSRGFTDVYNNAYLVQGLSRVPEETSGHTTTFTSNGPLLKATREMAVESLSRERFASIGFLGGVSDSMMATIMSSADIYVSLSRSDGTSASLLEAMASGAYPVLSDIPSNREWLVPGRDNISLVPLDDPPALATALDRAIRTPELRTRAAAFNRSLVSKRADASRTMDTLSASLDEMMGATRPAALNP